MPTVVPVCLWADPQQESYRGPPHSRLGRFSSGWCWGQGLGWATEERRIPEGPLLMHRPWMGWSYPPPQKPPLHICLCSAPFLRPAPDGHSLACVGPVRVTWASLDPPKLEGMVTALWGEEEKRKVFTCPPPPPRHPPPRPL